MAQRTRILMFALAGMLCFAGEVYADNQPVVVVPGRPGVPVIIQGFDATGAVVYGDWGPSRPGGTVVIEGGIWPLLAPLPEPPHYFPATGRTPAYGRKEVDPGPHRRGLAPGISQILADRGAAGSRHGYPPFAPPAVVVAPPVPRLR